MDPNGKDSGKNGPERERPAHVLTGRVKVHISAGKGNLNQAK